MLLALGLSAPLVLAEVPAVQQVALNKMGQLNGVALACREFAQSKRIKQALIDNLPKQRELGYLFDEKTNAAFLAFTAAHEPCPSPVAFSQEVGEAIEQLVKAFPSN